VASLTPADVKRWDPNAIHGVFLTASDRASTLQRLGDSLQQVHNNLSDWHGEAGDAFRADLGKTRRDIEADGQESKQVAAAVSSAEADVRACKAELDGIEQAADGYGWTITPDWRIDIGNTGIGLDRLTLAAQQQMLQGQLNACKVHAYSADHELAAAVRGAVGEVQLAASHPPGGAPQGAPKGPGGAQPKSWQDMLLPAGAAGAEPGGGPARGAPVPAGAGAGGKPPSLEDLMLGRGQPSGPGDQKPPAGSLPDLLSRLRQPGAPGGAPAPRLNPADVESFKAMARQTMIKDGVPPDQIEARLNDVVGRTQQWMDAGMPNYVAPEPPRPPAPGFAEGFGDRWFATEQGIKDLFGQGGPGAPGVLESWNNMAKGADAVLQNPLGLIVGEVKEAADAPSAAYYFGEKGADAAVTLPGLMFGPEGAGVGELGEIGSGALETGPAVSPHVPMGFDQPVGYNQWAELAASDLNYAHWHEGPTTALSEPVADMSTHYVGENPDRVVLGKFDGQEAGYIGEARGHGGIYFDTGNPVWDALTHGFGQGEERGLVWQVNEQFLRGQMESGASRIEYVLPDGFDSVEQLARVQRQSYSALEINFLKDNAAAYGYEQQGNAWVHVGGK
jgi:hypothetical protein